MTEHQRAAVLCRRCHYLPGYEELNGLCAACARAAGIGWQPTPGGDQPGGRPSRTCGWCRRVSYHPDDVVNGFCPCCGSADETLPKDCEHRRAGSTP